MTDAPLARLPSLPRDAVLVHVGPFKTGTTAIQTTLASMRQLLQDAGVSYPGVEPAHHRAAKSLMRRQEGGESNPAPPPPPEVWEELAREVSATSDRVVLSSEFLGDADDDARVKLVQDLGPDRVHILAAARNPVMLALSNWQQVVRTYGRAVSLEEWLEEAFRRSDRTPNRFWRRADPEALISGWARILPPERITVVVLDEADRTLLPATFERLLDLPDGALVGQPVPYSNRSLTSLEVTLIHRIIEGLDSKLSWQEYSRTMRNGVIKRLVQMREPGDDEGKARLPGWAIEQSATEAERGIAWLEASGVHLAGSLDSLRGPSYAVEGEDAPVEQVPIELAAEAALGAIAVAARGTWTLDAPPRGRRARLASKPRTRRDAGTERGGRNRSAGVAETSTPVDAVPTRELAVILGRRVRAALRRRAARLARGGRRDRA